MSEMTLWNPLKYIPSFEGLKTGSLEEIEVFMDIFETLDLPIITERYPEEDSKSCYLFANNRVARLSPDSGVIVNPLRQDDPTTYDRGYIYENPVQAVCWLICQLGFGPNTLAFESEALIFHIPANFRPLRLSFEKPLTDAKFIAYTQLVGDGTVVERAQNPMWGSRVTGHPVSH